MAYKDITMVRGDTLAFSFKFQGLNQALDTAYFSCKANPTDNTYLFQKSLSDGIEADENNVYKVRVAPDDTEDIPAGDYFYDLQVGVNDDIYTILIGQLFLRQDVTN